MHDKIAPHDYLLVKLRLRRIIASFWTSHRRLAVVAGSSPQSVDHDLDMLSDHSISAIIPLHRFGIGLEEIHVESSENVSETEVEFHPCDTVGGQYL
jgi:hypothetical protein